MKNTVLVIGGGSYVGSYVIDLLKNDFQFDTPSSQELDILNQSAIDKYLNQSDSSVVINFAAVADVDGAEKELGDKAGLTYRLNTLAVGDLAKVCKSSDKYLIHISTDYVFDGQKDSPYKEDDKPNPINWYGMTKYLGEQSFLESGCDGSIIRTEMPFTAKAAKKSDFARFFYNTLSSGKTITAPTDNHITPLYLDDLAPALKSLVGKKPNGIYHVATPTATTPYDIVIKIAEIGGFDKSLIQKVSFVDFNAKRIAKRPQNSWLNTTKFRSEFGEYILHTIDDSLQLFWEQMRLIENLS